MSTPRTIQIVPASNVHPWTFLKTPTEAHLLWGLKLCLESPVTLWIQFWRVFVNKNMRNVLGAKKYSVTQKTVRHTHRRPHLTERF